VTRSRATTSLPIPVAETTSTSTTVPGGAGCYWYTVSTIIDGHNVMLHPMIPVTKPAIGTTRMNGTRLEYTALSSTQNHVSLSLSGGNYVLQDTGAEVAAGAGCAAVDPNTVSCPASAVTSARIQTRDRDDSVTNSTSLLTSIDGGAGKETLNGGTGRDRLTGGGDDDVLNGDGGNDSLTGGAGNDTLNGGPGKDDMFGGSGEDTATYVSRTTPVTVTLDGLANDGAVGEHDNVVAEDVKGGARNDSLAGDGGPNSLSGTNDNDTIDGDGGNDVLAGGPGNDTVLGGPGDDQLSGGTGIDILRGLDGNDSLFARDATADGELDCDGGSSPGTSDIAEIDTIAPAPLGCESISSG
jgi:Ca2+-binding RTX toxin-like protein